MARIRNLLDRTRQVASGFIAGVFFAAALMFSFTPVLYALTVPATFGPRMFQTQQVHYERFVVTFNSCTYVSLTCSIKVGALPYNAFVLRIYAQTTTTWNAGTSASIGLGTVTPAVNLLASTNFTTAAAGSQQTVVAANLGLAVTGNGIAQSGLDGGFDLFATITIVGALPTAGQTTLLIEYVAPNDGNCTIVPLGATAVAC